MMTKNIFFQIGGAILGMGLVLGSAMDANHKQEADGKHLAFTEVVLIQEEIHQLPQVSVVSHVSPEEQQISTTIQKNAVRLLAAGGLGYMAYRSWPYVVEMLYGPSHSPIPPHLFDSFFRDFCVKKEYADMRSDLVSVVNGWCDRVMSTCACDWPNSRVGYELFYLYKNDTFCIPEQMLAEVHQSSQGNLSFAELFRLRGKFYGTTEMQLPSMKAFNESLYNAFQLYCTENLNSLQTVISSQLRGVQFAMQINRTEGIQYMQVAPFCLEEECVAKDFTMAFAAENTHSYYQSILTLGWCLFLYSFLSPYFG